MYQVIILFPDSFHWLNSKHFAHIVTISKPNPSHVHEDRIQREKTQTTRLRARSHSNVSQDLGGEIGILRRKIRQFGFVTLDASFLADVPPLKMYSNGCFCFAVVRKDEPHREKRAYSIEAPGNRKMLMAGEAYSTRCWREQSGRKSLVTKNYLPDV